MNEHAFAMIRGRRPCVLIVPALFDEGNRLRRLMAETMRRLDTGGIDSVLIDLPGCNESAQRLQDITLAEWQAAVDAAVNHYRPTRIVPVRGGALAVSPDLAARRDVLTYAPTSGAAILRQMIRMRVLALREAGIEANAATLLEEARRAGMTLAGYRLGPALIAGLDTAVPAQSATIAQSDIGGAPLWLRAEPDEDPAQAEALAQRIAAGACP